MTVKIAAICRKAKVGKEWKPLIALPGTSANYGKIVVFDDEGHNEGTIEWYAKTKPATEAECAGLLRVYRAKLAKGEEIVIKKRLNPDVLLDSWERKVA